MLALLRAKRAGVIHLLRKLFPLLAPSREGFRAFRQSGHVARVQLAVEANAQNPGAFPPDHRRPAERAAVQDHRRPGGQANRAIQLRTAGGQVKNLDSISLSFGLKERRQRDLDPRIDATVRERTIVRWGWNGACHGIDGLAQGCCREVNANLRKGWNL